MQEDAKQKAEADAAAKVAAEAEAKAAAQKKAAEEAERFKLMQEEAKLKAEADAAAKIAAEAEAAIKAAEAAEAAKKEHEAFKKRIQDETKAKFEEAARKQTDKAPIKFKDAVGRKFSFPFHLCSTWQSMEELIKQAFLHVDVIGPHVQPGHYDLTGPNGEIILPSVWEKVIEPDWSISMTMWPVEKMPPLGPKLPGGMPLPGRRHQMPIPPSIPGIAPAGRRPGSGMPPGMAPLPGWPGPAGRRPHIPNDVEIIDVGPGPSKPKSSKRNSAMLTFFAGKPAKKK
ncbi:hypothetical protein TOPH_09272 [Tolypocladium ophioglossoides CBS 100239]|uniref:Ubiquitin-like domain-containing protein n=1 Tax=Tolypocladium ophioglossoides (strain CBS 100239) TaxID=1163406 RepID=A0A0L0MWE2_TOLOC|nr:hypothetical protein TOPH_09272 [Tolypocladium ophioglossoides CBS 100239]